VRGFWIADSSIAVLLVRGFWTSQHICWLKCWCCWWEAFGLPSTSADSSIAVLLVRGFWISLHFCWLKYCCAVGERLLDFPALLLTQVLVLLVRGFWIADSSIAVLLVRGFWTSQHFCWLKCWCCWRDTSVGFICWNWWFHMLELFWGCWIHMFWVCWIHMFWVCWIIHMFWVCWIHMLELIDSYVGIVLLMRYVCWIHMLELFWVCWIHMFWVCWIYILELFWGWPAPMSPFYKRFVFAVYVRVRFLIGAVSYQTLINVNPVQKYCINCLLLERSLSRYRLILGTSTNISHTHMYTYTCAHTAGTDMGPPPASKTLPCRGGKQKSAVAAQMLLSVFDVELGRWVALYPKVGSFLRCCLVCGVDGVDDVDAWRWRWCWRCGCGCTVGLRTIHATRWIQTLNPNSNPRPQIVWPDH